MICGYFSLNFATHSRSMSSSPGLEGVSREIILVFGCIACSQSSGLDASTYVLLTPHFGKILVRIWWLDPNNEREDTTWSPLFSNAAKLANTAAIPEANASPA